MLLEEGAMDFLEDGRMRDGLVVCVVVGAMDGLQVGKRL